MRSRHQLLAPNGQAAAWPSPDGIYLVFGLDPPRVAGDPDAVIVPAAHLRHPALRQPDAGLLGDLVAHHPPVRGLLVLLRADVDEVLASLGRTWEHFGVDWEAVAASLLQGPQEPLVTIHGLSRQERALMGQSPHRPQEADGSIRELGRARREEWRASLTAELLMLLGNGRESSPE